MIRNETAKYKHRLHAALTLPVNFVLACWVYATPIKEL
jgi:hypothetical protein